MNPPPLPSAQSLFHRAAKYSLYTSLVALAVPIVMSCFGSVRLPENIIRLTTIIAGGIFLLLIVCSFLMGVVALFGIRKHGRKRIFGRALAGILISGFFILAGAFLTIAAYSRTKNEPIQPNQVSAARREHDAAAIPQKFVGTWHLTGLVMDDGVHAIPNGDYQVITSEGEYRRYRDLPTSDSRPYRILSLAINSEGKMTTSTANGTVSLGTATLKTDGLLHMTFSDDTHSGDIEMVFSRISTTSSTEQGAAANP